MIHTLTLNPALDYIVKLESLKAGETNRAYDQAIKAGGKGINVSKLLSNLGVETRAIAFVGGFTGLELKRLVEEDKNIDCDFIYIDRGFTRINTKIKGLEETEINGQGLDIKKEDINLLFDKLSEIKDRDYLVLSGSIPETLGDDFYSRIMERLKDKDINFILDTSGPALKKGLKYKPLLVKPNLSELEDLFSCKIGSIRQVAKYANILKDMGAKNVIVSLGDRGAYFISENKDSIYKQAPKGKLVDSVGSGDSMLAGFVYGLINNFSLMESFNYSLAAGSATAFSRELGKKDQIYRLYEKMS